MTGSQTGRCRYQSQPEHHYSVSAGQLIVSRVTIELINTVCVFRCIYVDVTMKV